VKDWLAQHPHQVVEFPFTKSGQDPFFNINNPEELLAAQSQLEKL